MDDATIYKKGLIAEKTGELSELRTMIKSYKESIDHLFFKYPYDLEKIDIEAVSNLNRQLLKSLAKYRKLKAEIEELGG